MFVDWCAATGQPALPTTPAVLAAFCTACPAAPATLARRLRVIRAVHADLGRHLPAPAQAPTPPAVRTGPAWMSIPDTLGSLPRLGYPAGVAGRRDAYLLVLLGVLGLTRNQARTLTADQISITAGQPVIAGRPVPRTDPPSVCPACAVTGWLRALAIATHDGHRTLAYELRRYSHHHPGRHDCTQPLADAWRTAPQLLPAIDQHGWLNPHTPMTRRAITAAIARRQALPVTEPEPATPRTALPRSAHYGQRHGHYEHADQLDAQLDALDHAIDQLLAATEQALHDSDRERS